MTGERLCIGGGVIVPQFPHAPSKVQRGLFPELYLSSGQGSPLAHASIAYLAGMCNSCNMLEPYFLRVGHDARVGQEGREKPQLLNLPLEAPFVGCSGSAGSG